MPPAMPQDQDICLPLQVPEGATVLWPFDFPVFIKFTLMCIFSCTHSLIGFNAFCSSSFCFVLGLRFVPEARLEVAGMTAILSIHCQERFSSNSLFPISRLVFLSLSHTPDSSIDGLYCIPQHSVWKWNR